MKMNHHTKQMVRGLRARVVALEAEVESLQQQLYALDSDAQESQRRSEQERWDAEESAAMARRRAQEAQREADAARSREYQRQDAVRELERARDWKRITGSRTADWDIDRAMKRLKDL